MAFYDPEMDQHNGFSYVELNKRRRGDGFRSEGDKLVNRMNRPKVKKIYVKRNGENVYEKPKLFVWRQWQSPKLEQLLEDVGPYVGLDDGATAIFTLDGDQIEDPDEIDDLGTYFIAGEEPLMYPSGADTRRNSDPDTYAKNKNAKAFKDANAANKDRYTSLSAPEYYTSNSVRSTYPSNIAVPPTPPPRPYTSIPNGRSNKVAPNTSNSSKKPKNRASGANDISEYNDYFDEAFQDDGYRAPQARKASPNFNFDFDFDENPHSSEFDNEMTIRRDKEALEKHRQKMGHNARRQSAMIFNRRDQTHPDAYIVYVFLNGQGMECQYMNFQRKQLERGMNYVLELIARKYNVNPAKLVDMDGKKISEVTQLMSRGAYVLIPVGQSFRDTWYFLPDNAIDTSTNHTMIEERSAQRDRLLQRRKKKEKKQKATRSKSLGPAASHSTATKVGFNNGNGRSIGNTKAASLPPRQFNNAGLY